MMGMWQIYCEVVLAFRARRISHALILVASLNQRDTGKWMGSNRADS